MFHSIEWVSFWFFHSLLPTIEEAVLLTLIEDYDR